MGGRFPSCLGKPDVATSQWLRLLLHISNLHLRKATNSPLSGLCKWLLLFAGSLRAGQRAAGIISLIHRVRLHGHDPYAYFKDVLDSAVLATFLAAWTWSSLSPGSKNMAHRKQRLVLKIFH